MTEDERRKTAVHVLSQYHFTGDLQEAVEIAKDYLTSVESENPFITHYEEHKEVKKNVNEFTDITGEQQSLF